MSKRVSASLLLALLGGSVPVAHAQTPAANPAQSWGSWFVGTVQLPSQQDYERCSYRNFHPGLQLKTQLKVER